MINETNWDYTTAIALSAAATDAFATLERIADLADNSCDISFAIRSLLIDRDETFSDFPDFITDALPHLDDIRAALSAIDARTAYPHDEHATHALSNLLLSYSLCPMHAIDYAICFDDDDEECAIIRAFFPIHDT